MYKFQTVYSPLLTSDWLAMCNVYCTLLCSYWLAMCSATLPLVGHVHYLYSPTLRLVGLLGRVQDQWIRIRLFAFVYQSWSQISKSLKELNNRKNSKLCFYFFKIYLRQISFDWKNMFVIFIFNKFLLLDLDSPKCFLKPGTCQLFCSPVDSRL